MEIGELNERQEIRQKISKVSDAEKKGIKYCRKGEGPSTAYNEYDEVFELHSENFGVGNQSVVQTFFFKLHKSRYSNDKSIHFCIIDNCWKQLPDTIAHWKDGIKSPKNFEDEYGGGSFIELSKNGEYFRDNIPNNRALVKLKCPAFYSNSCSG